MYLKTKFLNIFRHVFKIPFLEKSLRKLTQEKKPNDLICKLVPNNYQYPTSSYRTFNYNGVNLKVDIRDYVGHYLYFGFKDKGHEKLYQLTKKDDIVLDIGTNIGSTLLGFANIIGNKGEVYGFEPDKYNYEQCQQNITLNNFKNIEVANIGLGNEKGEFSLVVDTPTNRGGNRISLNNNNKMAEIITVDTLDNWFQSKKLSQIDLIKIDVEGFELNVLKGGSESIKKYQPKLFIELDDNNLKNVGNNASELILF